ncbi:centromere protein Chl4/mis15/CENP-N [Lipomyces tetrasporus]|uniref:Centromere protein Chl4/mis15/CENP-N n=1 Tax=Lipomyces tetrasporus TaxID=54092 RepID=A0AAD7QKY2_9ASCO|nr:centromere protein Chl4/mis15/CENP-N [Lipomyces tetrasporus]KAJ8096993.1 centromere protein Chl4/mis15/CENP-N [Lipomyces tetrasporus]
MQDDSIILPPGSHTNILLRLSRDSLVELAFGWLGNVPLCQPHRRGDEEVDPEVVVQHILGVREVYSNYQRKLTKKRTIVERMVYVDWFLGFNMRQVADIEFQNIFDRPLSHKWTASKVQIISTTLRDDTESIPIFHAPVFMKSLQRSLKSLIGSHIHITQHALLPVVLLRIQLHESGAKFAASITKLPTARHTFFCALPTSAHYIFHTALLNPYQKILRECIETALSIPGYQVQLQSTSLAARSLATLVQLRTKSRNATALGGWSIYANDEVDVSPLASAEAVVADKLAEVDENNKDDEARERKRLKMLDARFGVRQTNVNDDEENHTDDQGCIDSETALDHVEFRLEQEYEDQEFGDSFAPKVRIVFEGSHVFEGIRLLARKGLVDENKLPAWLTGELGVSSGVIANGQLVQR